MFEGSSIAVVVPCFKEETQIRGVIETMPAFVDRIIVVDDRSPDRTAEVVRECMRTHRNVELLIKDGSRYRSVKIDYRGGLRYPRLEKIAGVPSRLDDILTPRK